MKKFLCLLLCMLTALFLISCATQTTPSTSPSTEISDPTESSPTLLVTEPTVPPVTTIPTEPTVPPTTAPTEPPTQPIETPTEPIVIDSEILNSPSYQRLISLYNAEHFDPAALAAIARWIDSQEGFMSQYPEGWRLRMNLSGPSLECYSPLMEGIGRYFFWVDYLESDGTVEPCTDPIRMHAKYISRDWLTEIVYGADDPIGVPDEMKEAFIDFLIYHDMNPYLFYDPDQEITGYFRWRNYGSEAYITLYLKYYDDGRIPAGYFVQYCFFNGIHMMEGALHMPLEAIPDIQ